jgi:hypothetical protein
MYHNAQQNYLKRVLLLLYLKDPICLLFNIECLYDASIRSTNQRQCCFLNE